MISKDTSGISIVVMLQPSKLIRRVRFPYPAPKFYHVKYMNAGVAQW